MARKKKQSDSKADVAVNVVENVTAEESNVGTVMEAAEDAATTVVDATDSAQQPASDNAPDAAAATQSKKKKESAAIFDINSTDATLMMLSGSDNANEAIEEEKISETTSTETDTESNSDDTQEITTDKIEAEEPAEEKAEAEAEEPAEEKAETETEESEEEKAETKTEEPAEEKAETETEEPVEEKAEAEAEEPAEEKAETEAEEQVLSEKEIEKAKAKERISKSKARRNRRKKALKKAREEAENAEAVGALTAVAETANEKNANDDVDNTKEVVSDDKESTNESSKPEGTDTEVKETAESTETVDSAEATESTESTETINTDDEKADDNKEEVDKPASTENDEPEEQTDEEKPKRHYKLPIFAGLTAVIAVGSVLFIYLLFSMSGSALVQNASEVDLPNFVGKTAEEIKADPTFSNFDLEFVDIYSLDVEKGVVVSQTPKPPKMVKENAHIIIKVSEGLHTITVPSLIGLSKDEAVKQLKELGLSALVKTEVNDTVARNTVLSTEPVVGATVESGDTITVNVAGELKDLSVIVPDIVGMSRSDADALLREYGLSMGTIKQIASTAALGTVISQTPKAGDDSTKGSSITVTISSGAAPTPVATSTAGSSGGGGAAAPAGAGHAHNWVTTHVSPNATSIGFDMHTCTICGEVYYDNVVGPAG